MYSNHTKIKYTIIIAAAGVGKRMNLGYPKQFLEYKDKPLFINTVEVAEKLDLVTDIIIVTQKELIEEVEGLCKKYNLAKVSHIVEGGKERQDSIYNGLKYANEDGYIGVQDGVRPFLKEDYLERCYKTLEEEQNINGVVVGVPVKDTIKIIGEGGLIEATPKRETLYIAQTPQVFRGEILKEAYEKAHKEKFIGTDDASLVERYFGKVKLIQGDYDNIKITTVEDLKFLK